jgi:hypothetical protein
MSKPEPAFSIRRIDSPPWAREPCIERPTWFQVGVMCRCLARSSRPGEAVRDYLGLEVWLRCDPAGWSFSVFRNTDSSVI